MSKPSRIKGHCPDCGPDRWANVVAEHARETPVDASRGELYRLLECSGCGAVYVQRSAWGPPGDVRMNLQTDTYTITYHEKKSHWPSIKRPRPNWLHELNQRDQVLTRLAEEVYSALNADLRVLAAIGIRTCFDRAAELLGVDPGLSFSKKLDALAAAGAIGAKDIEALGVLIDAGGAAAHRGWCPTTDQLALMMDIIEAFIVRTFVFPERSLALRQDVPQRGKPKPSA